MHCSNISFSFSSTHTNIWISLNHFYLFWYHIQHCIDDSPLCGIWSESVSHIKWKSAEILQILGSLLKVEFVMQFLATYFLCIFDLRKINLLSDVLHSCPIQWLPFHTALVDPKARCFFFYEQIFWASLFHLSSIKFQWSSVWISITEHEVRITLFTIVCCSGMVASSVCVFSLF